MMIRLQFLLINRLRILPEKIELGRIYLVHIGNNVSLAKKMYRSDECPVPELLNKSLREKYRPKKSITEKKRNYFKTTSITTNRIKSTVHSVPNILAFYHLLANSANNAPDCFLRDTILICNFSQRLLILKNTKEHCWYSKEGILYAWCFDSGRLC